MNDRGHLRITAGQMLLGTGCCLLLWLLLAACSRSDAPSVPPRVGADELYSESFDGESAPGWRLEADESAQATVADGQLLIAVNAPGVVQYATLEEPLFDNFALEVDVTLLAGSLNSSYGVLFRLAGPDQFYRYTITGNGDYLLERYDGEGAFVRLTDDWQRADALLQGLNETNRLGLVAAGGTYSLYANGQLIAQLQDGRFTQGRLALSAGTFGQPGLQVAFDNLVVRAP